MKPPFDIAADLDTPVSAYLKLAPFRPRFLLESVEGGERLARYSFIGFGDCLEVRIDAEGVNIGGVHSPRPKNRQEFLSVLRGALARAPGPLPKIPGVPLLGGLVGYTAYDAVRYFEHLPGRSLDTTPAPHAHYVAPRSLLVFDHLTRGVALLHDGTEADRQALRREVIQALRGAVPLLAAGKFSKALPSLTEEAHAARVRRAQEYIASGDVYQLVLASRFEGKQNIAPFEAYRALRLLNPSPYMYLLDSREHQIVGASPEMLMRVHEGVVSTRPIAGTRPRGENDEEDRALEAEILVDEKEIAEHVMLVDLGRNDIGRVATPGTVRVERLAHVERFSHLMHLVSHVDGELREGLDAFDAFNALFPAGTLTGAPKVRAMELIDEFEPVYRGPYGGAVGYFSLSGNADFAITIRTVSLREGVATVQAGGGVVADSQGVREYQETLNKASAPLLALEIADA